MKALHHMTLLEYIAYFGGKVSCWKDCKKATEIWSGIKEIDGKRKVVKIYAIPGLIGVHITVVKKKVKHLKEPIFSAYLSEYNFVKCDFFVCSSAGVQSLEEFLKEVKVKIDYRAKRFGEDGLAKAIHHSIVTAAYTAKMFVPREVLQTWGLREQ